MSVPAPAGIIEPYALPSAAGASTRSLIGTRQQMFCNGFAFIRATFLGKSLDVDPTVKGDRFTRRPREVWRDAHTRRRCELGERFFRPIKPGRRGSARILT